MITQNPEQLVGLLWTNSTSYDFGQVYFFVSLNKVSKLYAVVLWLALLHNFIQQSLNLGSAQVQILLVTCQRFEMVRISNNGPGWK